ncbi:MAG TPA: hypothetical protein VGQ90_13210 [Stellaceae bacterium]|jgi:hypothetical protein|nr:hypothetical protein [Stellaceae bacterium]
MRKIPATVPNEIPLIRIILRLSRTLGYLLQPVVLSMRYVIFKTAADERTLGHPFTTDEPPLGS